MWVCHWETKEATQLYTLPCVRELNNNRAITCSSYIMVMLPERGPGPEQVCLGPAGSEWVLDFVQKRFQSPGNYETTFIKAGDGETRKG